MAGFARPAGQGDEAPVHRRAATSGTAQTRRRTGKAARRSRRNQTREIISCLNLKTAPWWKPISPRRFILIALMIVTALAQPTASLVQVAPSLQQPPSQAIVGLAEIFPRAGTSCRPPVIFCPLRGAWCWIFRD